MQPITFIYTNSLDLTVDLLISKIAAEGIFRFNFDLWREYKIKIDPHGFWIENPVGRCVHSGDIEKFYWRRPHTTSRLYPGRKTSEEIIYMEEEIYYAFRDIVNLLWAQGKIVLTEPMADSRIGKFVQLKVAQKYFKVPAYKFVCGSPDNLEKGKLSVVKSLSSERVKGSLVLYTTRVTEDQLDYTTPWLIQEYIPATKDITVVFVRGEVFGFELNREGFLDQTVDWREMGPDTATDAWLPHALPKKIVDSIRPFMNDLGLHFGRLDMLFCEGDYFFLEVNANGEWAWLDFDGKNGLLDKILGEISPLTPRYCIPIARGIVF
jgi:hypothetical protein